MIKNRTYFDLTEKEIRQAAKLTPDEREKIDAFLAAAKALPKGIVIETGKFSDEPAILVSKKITSGSAQVVAKLRKKSLIF